MNFQTETSCFPSAWSQLKSMIMADHLGEITSDQGMNEIHAPFLSSRNSGAFSSNEWVGELLWQIIVAIKSR